MKKFMLVLLVLIFSVTALSETVLKIDLQDTQPKYIKNADGTYSGICIELLELIEENSDYKFEYNKSFLPSKRIQYNMEKGSADIHMGWSRNSKREALFTFGEPLYDVATILISNKSFPKDINDLNELNKVGSSTVLAVQGVGSNEYLKKNLGLKLDDSGRDTTVNLQKLMSKRADYFTYHNLGLLYKLRDAKYQGKFKVHGAVLRSYQHWMVFSKSTPQNVVDDINKIVKKLKASGEWQKVTDKYLKL